MNIAILYHYFYPDDVISARLFSDLAQHLVKTGHTIEALPCNRSCRNEKVAYPAKEDWEGIQIKRIRRPALRQSTTAGRIINSIYMMASWSAHLIRRKPDLIIIGTDPQGGLCILPFVRPYLRKTKIFHWCHDLYPQLLRAEGMLSENNILYKAISTMTRKAYRHCDCIVDIGPQMRNILNEECPYTKHETITPWGLTEAACVRKPDIEIRRKLFGTAKLALLYSGNYGRAHCANLFFTLARSLRHDSVKLLFSVRGNKVNELKALLHADDNNIEIISCVNETDLQSHLESADMHLASLKEEFSGLAVPSKYFGSIALGRPVIYSGHEKSDIARWINMHGTGYVINSNNTQNTAMTIKGLISDPALLSGLQTKTRQCYADNFSKAMMLNQWTTLTTSRLAGISDGRIDSKTR